MTTPVGSHIEKLFAECRDLEPRDRALYVDFPQLPRRRLPDEGRSYVDGLFDRSAGTVARQGHRELAFRMPASLKYTTRQTKVLLKERVAARRPARLHLRRSRASAFRSRAG